MPRWWVDPGPVLDAIGRLRAVYPNVMSIRRPEPQPPDAGDSTPHVPAARALDETTLFRSFFAHGD